MPLSKEEIQQFQEDGYVLLGAILEPSEVEELLDEERRFRPAPKGTLLVSMQLCHRSEPVRRFCMSGRHVRMVADLLGPDVCLTHQQFIVKLPDEDDTTSEISLHQDNGYGRLDPPTDVTVWVALHDTTEANGCLQVVPGSHVLGVLPHEPSGANRALREARVEAGEPVLVPMRAGEAVALTGQTLHASGPNRTDRERVGLFARYCEPSVVMVTEGGRPVLEDAHSWMVLGEYRAPRR